MENNRIHQLLAAAATGDKILLDEIANSHQTENPCFNYVDVEINEDNRMVRVEAANARHHGSLEPREFSVTDVPKVPMVTHDDRDSCKSVLIAVQSSLNGSPIVPPGETDEARQCNVCEAIFPTQKCLERHIRHEHHSCKLCKQVFMTEILLSRHIVFQHHMCNHCGRLFKWKHHLLCHNRFCKKRVYGMDSIGKTVVGNATAHVGLPGINVALPNRRHNETFISTEMPATTTGEQFHCKNNIIKDQKLQHLDILQSDDTRKYTRECK